MQKNTNQILVSRSSDSYLIHIDCSHTVSEHNMKAEYHGHGPKFTPIIFIQLARSRK